MATHVLVPRALRRIPVPARRHSMPDLLADFDRLFDAFSGGALAPRGTAAFAPPLDYMETEDEIRISAELPGLEEKDIRVSLEEGLLTIEGERADERSEDDEKGFRHVESYRGSFRRALRLGAEVEEDEIKAVYKNGVLTITLPKLAAAGPEIRTIPVSTS